MVCMYQAIGVTLRSVELPPSFQRGEHGREQIPRILGSPGVCWKIRIFLIIKLFIGLKKLPYNIFSLSLHKYI